MKGSGFRVWVQVPSCGWQWGWTVDQRSNPPWIPQWDNSVSKRESSPTIIDSEIWSHTQGGGKISVFEYYESQGDQWLSVKWRRPFEDAIMCSYVQWRLVRSNTSVIVGGVIVFHFLVIVNLAANSIWVSVLCRVVGSWSISRDRSASAGFIGMWKWAMSDRTWNTFVQYGRSLGQLHRVCRRSPRLLHCLQHALEVWGLNLEIVAGV